jgi:hypothetical protein
VADQAAAHIALQSLSAKLRREHFNLEYPPLEYRWVLCRSIVTCSRLPAATFSISSIKRESAGTTNVSAIIFIISAKCSVGSGMRRRSYED